VADRVVLGAGTVGSTRFLLENRATLPGLSPMLGRRVSANGDALAWVRHATRLSADGARVPHYLDPSRGPVITTSIDVPAERSASGREFHIQDAGAPAFAEWMWQGLEAPGDVWRARRRLARRVASHISGRRRSRLGGLLSALMGTTETSAAMMPLLGMGRDLPDGRFRLRGSELELDWSSDASEAYYQGLRHGFREVAGALGGRALDPLEHLSRNVTVHAVGGCPMGTDRRRGVVDPWGQVHRHPGLYVADGAALPGPVGPNPSFTIAAFADRVAEAILDGRPVSAA
jgi:cholesterol oxidase